MHQTVAAILRDGRRLRRTKKNPVGQTTGGFQLEDGHSGTSPTIRSLPSFSTSKAPLA